MARVLIIDDDSGVRTLLRDLLEDAGYEVIDADNGDSGFNLYAANPADLVLTDIYMPKSGSKRSATFAGRFPVTRSSRCRESI